MKNYEKGNLNVPIPVAEVKPDALQKPEGRFTFVEGGRLVEIAEKCGAAPIGHVLVCTGACRTR